MRQPSSPGTIAYSSTCSAPPASVTMTRCKRPPVALGQSREANPAREPDHRIALAHHPAEPVGRAEHLADRRRGEAEGGREIVGLERRDLIRDHLPDRALPHPAPLRARPQRRQQNRPEKHTCASSHPPVSPAQSISVARASRSSAADENVLNLDASDPPDRASPACLEGLPRIRSGRPRPDGGLMTTRLSVPTIRERRTTRPRAVPGEFRPLVDPSARWRDDLDHDDAGRPASWHRRARLVRTAERIGLETVPSSILTVAPSAAASQARPRAAPRRLRRAPSTDPGLHAPWFAIRSSGAT